MAHEWSHALAGAKFGQRSKSWCRTISRCLGGAVKCIAMTSYNWPLWSRALFIGAARHLQTCVCMRSPTLNEFGPKMLRSRKRFPNCASCLAICARKLFQIFHPYFNGRILTCIFHGRWIWNASVWDHLAATQPSVLQEPRAFLF